MPASTKPPLRRIHGIRKTHAIPTLAQMIREGQESAAKIKRASKEALAEWFAQSERLNVARSHHGLRGEGSSTSLGGSGSIVRPPINWSSCGSTKRPY